MIAIIRNFKSEARNGPKKALQNHVGAVILQLASLRAQHIIRGCLAGWKCVFLHHLRCSVFLSIICPRIF